ncbi:hypothetical protein C8R48DRAFT_671335 [Suillus tomentosus]|nr:hypothetical protein C8R48DRAFT_671335 [Suillus tomentosus]
MAGRAQKLSERDVEFTIYIAKVFLTPATEDRDRHQLPNVIRGPMTTGSMILMRDREATRREVEFSPPRETEVLRPDHSALYGRPPEAPASAAEVRFGPVLGPLNANPEPDHRSGSGNEGERRTGPFRTRSEAFGSSSEHVRTSERYV